MPLRAGQLNDRVTLQSSTTTDDGQGGAALTWANLATAPTVWAAVRMVSGGDQADGAQTVSRRRYEVTIRRRDDVTSVMRVIRGASTLAILSVNDDREEPDRIILLCEEVTP